MSNEITIDDYSKNNVLIRLNKESRFSFWNPLFTKAGAILLGNGDNLGWIFPKSEIDRLENILHLNSSKSHKKRSYTKESRSPGVLSELKDDRGFRSRGSRDKKFSSSTSSDRSERSNPSKKSHSIISNKSDKYDRSYQSNDSDRSRYKKKLARIRHNFKIPQTDSPSDDEDEKRSYRYSTSEDEDSSDDELVRHTLSRRLTSYSTQKVLDSEEIENSDNEDVISLNRRLRHVYEVIKSQRSKITELEDRLNNLSNK